MSTCHRTPGPVAASEFYGADLGFSVSTCERRDDPDGLKLSSSAVRAALRNYPHRAADATPARLADLLDRELTAWGLPHEIW